MNLALLILIFYTVQATGLFSLNWSGEDGPDQISREEAWKLYIRKLQDESNYLLNTPDSTEICCCEDCIVSSDDSSQL